MMQWTNESISASRLTPKIGWILLAFLLLARLIAMYFVPLNDSTEARYGEIARIMLETGDWITPMHHYGEPFWAKPPLSTWGSALAMKGFGVSAFSARLPGLVLSLGILALVFHWARRVCGTRVAMNAILILASSFYFFLNAGTVMTDPTLLFCTTLGLTAFWHAVMYRDRLFGYVFFISLGLGLLAKGPVAVVLTTMPLVVWTIWNKQYRAVWQQLPWGWGSLLTLVIAVPWYGLAELKTPGFLYYFIVGEHIHRFLEPGWTGDKYGFAHVAPYGMIWIYALIGTCPWSAMALYVGLKTKRKRAYWRALTQKQDPWMSYLILCTGVPLLFFTFARNIIYPYVFPSLPTFALLVAVLAARLSCLSILERYVARLAPISGVIFLILTVIFLWKPEWVEKSQQRVVAAYQQDRACTPTSKMIYWAYKTEYSAHFYSRGHAFATRDPAQLSQWLDDGHVHYVVVDSEEKIRLPALFQSKMRPIATVEVLKKTFTLFRTKQPAMQHA